MLVLKAYRRVKMIRKQFAMDINKAHEIFGSLNGNLTAIEHILNVEIELSENGVSLSGDDENIIQSETVLQRLMILHENGENIGLQLVTYLSEMARDGNLQLVSGYSPDSICVTAKGRPIRSKTIGQKEYVKAIDENDIVFAIGPAGTGKTFLAVAMAVNAFRNRKISRIILTRPAVEAGEKLGFLPGDLQNKLDPYMKPLYDSMNELMGSESYLKSMERGHIEISPLAYMRGRTLDDSFIILDEAQNSTPEQMKMFLTRIGFNSKVVVTGDITQIDLPIQQKCGLIEARKILKGVEGIKVVVLSEKDVVRSGIVQKIIRAYEKSDERERV
jgi:phosphate starvation-inducible protein PhoH and related proteins